MSRPSAPLAACGVLLATLALVTLARPRAERPPPPAPEPSEPVPDSPQRQRLLAEEPIDVNAADAAELELLPRIGPALAARIVEERERAGRFASVESLARVRGIGPRTVERLRPLVTVTQSGVPSPPAALHPPEGSR